MVDPLYAWDATLGVPWLSWSGKNPIPQKFEEGRDLGVSTILGRILLTGGAGFIGSHVAEALLRRGAELTIVDNLDKFYSPEWKRANLAEVRRVGKFNFFEQDICEYRGIRELTERVRPEVVIHLAARAGVRPSIERPLLYQQVNIAGTLNLLETCRELGIGKFIFGSSSSVYGATSKAPFSEDQVECKPISPYAATKLSGELLCYTYAHLFKLSIVCLRFFTVYGPRQRPDLAIHKFTALAEAGKSIPIFGDGSTGRDYTFVEDIVAGIVSAAAYEPPRVTDLRFDIFNLGNSHPVKLSELVDTIEHATGRKLIREQRELQPGDVPLTWADISKAQRLLGYQPATKFGDGIQRFVSWYRSVGSGRRS
jgi:UDP-glucuronate 4-epimerase